MSFITSGTTPTPAANPEALFRDLPRLPHGPKHLWAHQADILRDYLNHQSDPDLAIELPTGAGKTLVGMLIGEWRRRTLNERVVYLCPTLQLARQAVTDARAAGISVVDLTGSNWSWDNNDRLAYTQGQAIAVAHYKAVFNSNSQLDDADLLIFDDAHAAAGAIADTWTVRFDHGTTAYTQIVELLTAGLPGTAAVRLLAATHDSATRAEGYLIDPQVVTANLPTLTQVVDTQAQQTNARYSWRMVRDSVDACSVFASADEVIIRPLLPPTSTHDPYTSPKQRLYLSATIGAGGELERAFGRRRITRMAVPAGWDERGTGRRFFVFPELTNEFARAGGDTTAGAARAQFVSDLMREAGRSLLLAPSNYTLDQVKQLLVPAGFKSLTATDVETTLAPFTSESRAVLGLANRYDGIDLPDDQCRLIVFAGLPVGADPQEKFYTTLLGAKRVLQERTRTRFAQGAGRATRNTNDRAVVVVLGQPLIAFAGDREVQQGTHPEIRAELEIGIRNSSRRPAAEVGTAIRQFLDQDPSWNTHIEPEIRTLRERYADADDAEDTKALNAAAAYEIQALDAAWRGNFGEAVRQAERAIQALAGGAELRPYQALWNYLAAHWARLAATADPTYAVQADALMRAANAAASRTTWMPNRQLADGTAATAEAEASRLDKLAVDGVIAHAKSVGKPRALTRAVTEMKDNLSQREAGRYEQGLVTLGRLLGADSHKPTDEARADAVWRWSNEMWVAWEAKSEAKDENDISADDIRQANTHLRAASKDLDEEVPPGSHIFLVSGKSTVHEAARALAVEELSFTPIDDVQQIAERVEAVWMSLQGRLLSGADADELRPAVLKELADAGVLPSQVLQTFSERLF
ncbi:DEAD/DEAH box helicase family protein [Nocardioides psychrotolerans]|uniref:DEAD/DEAH box helicase family protein n=1 Tax=Nocardioides psychrotolerans TaxID=1005945 RepID=UPI00313828DF